MISKKVSIGSWISLGHYSIAEIMADRGFDWLCIDLEHSVIDYYQAEMMIAAIQSKNLPAYVRVGENNQRIIKRILDAGADGIIVPMVMNKAEAIKAVESVNYPPKGKRGVGLARAQKYGFGFEEYKKNKAKNINLIVQIEHYEAVENLDEILSIDGVHGTIIGPYDLSGSLGKPGEFDDKEVKEALMKYENIARKYDKLIGYHVVQPDYTQVLEKIEKGYNFIAFGVDILFLGNMCQDQMAKLKNNLQ